MAKNYKEEEVVESRDHQHPDVIGHAKEEVIVNK